MSTYTRSGLTLAPGVAERYVMDVFDRVSREGPFAVLVDRYAERGEIDPGRFSDTVRQSMVDWLLGRGVRVSDIDAFNAGQYDELFALAYEHAATAASGRDDPIEASRSPGAVAAWDFTVDEFDAVEAQGILPENILAAGAIDYVFELGEVLGCLPVCDALVLEWAAGHVDVADGEAAAKLYRYYKLRDQRSSLEERAMLYRRVLNKGGGRVLGRMVVNESFPTLWMNLMAEVAEYIGKRERISDGATSGSLSRSGLFHATRELQYNLTDFCTGMSHMQVRELYAQLQDAMELLGDPEVVAHFGGTRRKSMWTVIQRLAKQEFGTAPNVGAIRTSAVMGNRVFRWIADFQDGATPEDAFERFLEAAEAYIHARSAVSGEKLLTEGDEHDEWSDGDEFGEFDELDDFDDGTGRAGDGLDDFDDF